MGDGSRGSAPVVALGKAQYSLARDYEVSLIKLAGGHLGLEITKYYWVPSPANDFAWSSSIRRRRHHVPHLVVGELAKTGRTGPDGLTLCTRHSSDRFVLGWLRAPLHFSDAAQFPGPAHHDLKHKMKREFSHNMCNTICRELLPTGVSYPCTHSYAPWTPLPGPRPTQMARPPPVRTANGRGRAHFASLHTAPAAFCCRARCSSTYTPHRTLNDPHWPQT